MPPRLKFPDRRFRPSAVAIGVAALVLWAPLPFASVVPWSVVVLRTAVLVLAVLAAFTGDRANTLAPVAVPVAALLLVGALGWLQSTPIPTGAARFLAPETFRLVQASAALAPDSTTPHTLSLAPEASRAAALSWATFALLLLAAAAAGRRRPGRRLVAVAIGAAALFQVIFGAQHIGWSTIWDVEVPGATGRLRGTFVNSDHLALFLSLALAVVFAWVWAALRRAHKEIEPERKVLILAAPLVLWLTVFLGLAFSGSRAGFAAALVTAAAQGLLVAREARRWRLSPSGILAAAVGLGVVAVIGLRQGLGRFLATSAHELTWNQRLRVSEATLELWQRSPLLGTGLGTFREASPLVTQGLGSWYWHAHNDYLELLATTGIVGGVIVATAVGAILVRLLRRPSEGVRTEVRAATLAALGALVALAVHSFFDFGLSIPADATLAVVIVGVALGARAESATSS